MGHVILYLLFFVVFCGSAHAMTDSSLVRRELRPYGDKWAVVEVRDVMGTLVVMAPEVGREIDLEVCNRFGMFQGETVYNRKLNVPTLTYPIEGFQSAVFMKLSDGQYGIKVVYRNEWGLQDQLLRLNDRAELGRIQNYLNRMIGVSDTALAEPKELDETVTCSTVTPKFISLRRLNGSVILFDGGRVKGRLLPVVEDGQLLIETPLGFRRVDIETVSQVSIGGRGGIGVIQKTVQGGIQWAIVGGLTGLMAGAVYEGATVKQEVLYGAVVGGTAGAAFGFLNGLFSVELARTFVLDPPGHPAPHKIEVTPTLVRLHF